MQPIPVAEGGKMFTASYVCGVVLRSGGGGGKIFTMERGAEEEEGLSDALHPYLLGAEACEAVGAVSQNRVSVITTR